MEMENPTQLVGRMRRAAGLSQRELAERARTSQPAIARYERGAATPSWTTLQRLAAACGRRARIEAELVPDPHDAELAGVLLELTPAQRLRVLRRYARMRAVAREKT